VFDLRTGAVKRRIDLAGFPPLAKLATIRACRDVTWSLRFKNFFTRQRIARPLFTRGMCRLDGSRHPRRHLAGHGGGVGLQAGSLARLCQLSHSANECVHGLEAAPSVDFPFIHSLLAADPLRGNRPVLPSRREKTASRKSLSWH